MVKMIGNVTFMEELYMLNPGMFLLSQPLGSNLGMP